MSKRVRRAQPNGCLRNKKLRDLHGRDIDRAALKARTELVSRSPLQSAKRPAGRLAVAIMIFLIVATTLGATGLATFQQPWIIACSGFAALGVLRALACFFPMEASLTIAKGAIPEATPIWTILIALYREADSVPSLLAALAQLEWSKDRLDIIFACEADDQATIDVLIAYQETYKFRIIRVPQGGPRTKPNALQTALPFAEGRFITVYDAEDRPDPQQLRAAFDAFLSGPPNLAVVQAPLVTWNHAESWIARQFALDYAIWFRVVLPAFARVSGLIPLGGTSNHFRTDILRTVGGWDPYNVTEDADLGIRLGRCGYVASLISPPTFEEAPPQITAWVKQRGRWIQGHIQTLSIHLRTPFSLAHDIGWRGSLAFVLGLGIGPLSALIVLPFTIGLFGALGSNASLVSSSVIGVGILGHVLAAIVACHRDGRWTLITSLASLPLYHCLQSAAACRAMWRVVFTPSIWDKTEHGCAARTPKNESKTAWTLRRHWPFSASAQHYSPLPPGGPPVLPCLEKSA